jgi:3-hydroxyacyl-[acyl-carrier-protein] dehydratase
MPPQLLFDITNIDLNRILYTQEQVREANPQRGHMEMLNAISYVKQEEGEVAGYKDVREDEFWVPGHIPGRPLFPGVLMVEAAAQLASFYTRNFIGWKNFIGFGGIEETKFRGQVVPPCRLYLLGKLQWHRHRRIGCKVQGLVNGNLMFETGIVGTQM